MKADGLIQFAKKYLGSTYVLGAFVPKNNSTYKGAFDCAEFVAFVNFQVLGILYGCSTADINKADKADAYTGFFGRDAQAKGIIISVERAARTKGAMLLRLPRGGGAIGHIGLSQGTGKTVEAYNSRYGVIESVVDGRRWDYGLLLPDVEYTELAPVITNAPVVVYRLKTPLMKGDFVGEIQRILGVPVDYIYGKVTQAAVVEFQKLKGLVVDGEVMPNGETAKALGIKK